MGLEGFHKTARRPFGHSLAQEEEGVQRGLSLAHEEEGARIPFRMDFGRFRKTQGTPLCFAIFMIFDHFRSTIQTLLGWVWRVSTKPRGAHLATRCNHKSHFPGEFLYVVGAFGEHPGQISEQAITQTSRFIFQRSVLFWVVCSPPHYVVYHVLHFPVLDLWKCMNFKNSYRPLKQDGTRAVG